MLQQLPHRPPRLSPALKRSGGLGTAGIVMTVAYTVIQWALAISAVDLTASGTASGVVVLRVLGMRSRVRPSSPTKPNPSAPGSRISIIAV